MLSRVFLCSVFFCSVAFGIEVCFLHAAKDYSVSAAFDYSLSVRRQHQISLSAAFAYLTAALSGRGMYSIKLIFALDMYSIKLIFAIDIRTQFNINPIRRLKGV